MIQIEWDSQDGFCIVGGIDEFFDKIGKNGTVKVQCNSDGKTYYVHEVGEQVHLLSQDVQNAMEKSVNKLIRDIAANGPH